VGNRAPLHKGEEREIGCQTVTVATFADGQSDLYHVLKDTVDDNSMGLNAEDNLLYAIAVCNGLDSLGQPVERSDLVMINAEGYSY
jgi:serralysin